MALLSSDTVPQLLPRVFPLGNCGGKRWYVTIGHVPDDRRNVVKRSY